MKYALLLWLAACGAPDVAAPAPKAVAPVGRAEARIPRASGELGPSMVAIRGAVQSAPGDISTGTMLADTDSCATCHPDVAAQWASSSHSIASFGNPIYRFDVEQVRTDLGKVASQDCGGCHDMPLLVDGLMTAAAPIAADDLRAHSGVTCRLCHGVQSTTYDGNGSYVWNATPIDAPQLGDAASIARHRAAVTTKVDSQLCIGCHRGFLSPDLGVPAHLSGLDETGTWQSSAYTGNGTGRIDAVPQQTCIDCHMERVAAGEGELGRKHGTVASHRFVGGHTWMASMRGDTEQLRQTQAKLAGAASIDIAGARLVGADGVRGAWKLPAETATVRGGQRIELDVVIRNLLVGHRFPGGLLDVQDSWIEVEVADRRGERLAASGLAHELDPTDTDAHILRTLVVDQKGEVLDEHQLAQFRAMVATQTLAPREAQAVRYGFTVPATAQLPLTVTARLRHRSRSLALQAATCRAAKTAEGQAFIAGERGARDGQLDPCKAQPITLIAQTQIELGRSSPAARPTWERVYELGMALAQTTVLRLGEAQGVLATAHELAPDPRARAMVAVQQGWVASRLGHVDEAIAEVREAREALGSGASPAVLDAITTDAYVRANRWAEAVAPAKACTERAPGNTAAWGVYAAVLVAVGDHVGALGATARGLALAPRDPDLLRSQATALAALRDPQAQAAQAAYARYRSPDEAAGLRIRCANQSARCRRDRNSVHTLELH